MEHPSLDEFVMSPEIFQKVLHPAGIEVNGGRPEDLRVHREEFYERVLSGGSLALGESFMERLWDCEALDTFFYKILRAGIANRFPPWRVALAALQTRVLNPQSRRRARRVAELHYDLGNDFYEKMLGPTMQYTCGYWRRAKNLDEAQEDKLDLICRKLQLKPDDRVLEMGGGWGGFARFAAERYGCHVTSYNISKEQVKYAREWTRGLPVEIIEKDYREATGSFDKVVSIGMCEHVGVKNYRSWFELQERCLKPGGLMLLHTIGRNTPAKVSDPWITKYIFPGGILPCLKQLMEAAQGLFVLEDLHNIGPDYDRTLLAWYENYRELLRKKADQLGDRFDRMWTYYLLSCAGAFRARSLQLWQLVFSKEGHVNGYIPER
ncbi:MAG TPA: cyclopropane fatty acyl phospholipid synthase [Opitutales bacterium]|nr:cyclopropane fatty acyl phospholipid synthase [Opitutales bacterium]